jgi:hypothetical protein
MDGAQIKDELILRWMQWVEKSELNILGQTLVQVLSASLGAGWYQGTKTHPSSCAEGVIRQFLYYYCCCSGGTLWHLQKFSQYNKYIILEVTLFILLLYPLSPNSWNSFNRCHFSSYIHVYTLFLPYPTSYTFSSHPPPPTDTNPSDKTYSALLFSDFCFKKMTFLLV